MRAALQLRSFKEKKKPPKKQEVVVVVVWGGFNDLVRSQKERLREPKL